MITAQKHLDLDNSVLRVAAVMLRELKKRRVLEFSALRKKVLKAVGSESEIAFHSALSFLFVVGKLEYHVKNDSFEYKEG
ncbi:hypothetical protein B5K08_31085 [Rhizobium leguminosarum bv. trifolii]|uniref:Uncharacterized protein n=1 Tax=Rhizobium leguminosarum bv. trifolii TaxID=386 RepID=A0A3E1AY89_RHILT|nr:ABC-three component system middle component 8 [Rhizobium leguminosarum]RFB82155.1 hypothetical protein B5K10_31080 [Rhizobium leguminosarum bv. trifolii]RFB82660.1 hypothetical protein B5K08_31085 [Rhizobium leguminosarum bv. trifolii]